MFNIIIYLIVAAISAASITYTLCCTSIFRRPREYIAKKIPRLESLVYCPYCLGHYISLIIVLLIIDKYNTLPITNYTLINVLLMWFMVITIMSLVHKTILKTYEPIAKAKAMRAKLKNQEARMRNYPVGFVKNN